MAAVPCRTRKGETQTLKEEYSMSLGNIPHKYPEFISLEHLEILETSVALVRPLIFSLDLLWFLGFDASLNPFRCCFKPCVVAEQPSLAARPHTNISQVFVVVWAMFNHLLSFLTWPHWEITKIPARILTVNKLRGRSLSVFPHFFIFQRLFLATNCGDYFYCNYWVPH